MTIHYDTKHDLLHLRLASTEQALLNKRVSEDIVLDIGENDKIIGIEIMDASKHINLDKQYLSNIQKLCSRLKRTQHFILPFPEQ